MYVRTEPVLPHGVVCEVANVLGVSWACNVPLQLYWMTLQKGRSPIVLEITKRSSNPNASVVARLARLHPACVDSVRMCLLSLVCGCSRACVPACLSACVHGWRGGGVVVVCLPATVCASRRSDWSQCVWCRLLWRSSRGRGRTMWISWWRCAVRLRNNALARLAGRKL